MSMPLWLSLPLVVGIAVVLYATRGQQPDQQPDQQRDTSRASREPTRVPFYVRDPEAAEWLANVLFVVVAAGALALFLGLKLW